MKPRADEVVVAQLRVPTTDRTLEQRRANPIVADESTATTLPKTASLWPTVLVVGLLALFGAGVVRSRRNVSFPVDDTV